MTAHEQAHRATRVLPQAVAALALALAAALALPASPAAASNSGVSGCLMAYNYSDPGTDYLYAASNSGTIDCQYVYVSISDGGAPLAWDEGFGWATTSVTVPSSTWNSPSSFHTGAYHYGWMDYWLFLDFIY